MAEIRTRTCIEIKKGDRTYQLYCENDSPLGEIYDFSTEICAIIKEKMNEMSPKPLEKTPEVSDG